MKKIHFRYVKYPREENIMAEVRYRRLPAERHVGKVIAIQSKAYFFHTGLQLSFLTSSKYHSRLKNPVALSSTAALTLKQPLSLGHLSVPCSPHGQYEYRGPHA